MPPTQNEPVEPVDNRRATWLAAGVLEVLRDQTLAPQDRLELIATEGQVAVGAVVMTALVQGARALLAVPHPLAAAEEAAVIPPIVAVGPGVSVLTAKSGSGSSR